MKAGEYLRVTLFQMLYPAIMRVGNTRQSADVLGIFRDSDDHVCKLMPIQLDGLSERFVTSCEGLVTRRESFVPIHEGLDPASQGFDSFVNCHECFLSSV